MLYVFVSLYKYYSYFLFVVDRVHVSLAQ